jgi:hypothetical protein
MEERYFEATAAVLAQQAQLVPLYSYSDLNSVKDVIRYLTPQLTIMGGYFSQEQLSELLQLGFKEIYVFVYNDEELSKYATKVDETWETFNKNVILFDLSLIYETLDITPGLAASMMMEKVMCFRFQSVKPEGFTKDDAIAFVNGVKSTGKTFSEVVSEIAYSWKGFEMEEEMTLRGKIIGRYRKQIARDRVAKCGTALTISHNGKNYSACAVPTTEFVREVKQTIPCKEYQIGVIYRYEPKVIDEKQVGGYYLGFSSAPNSGINVKDVLVGLIGEESVVGIENDSAGWAPTKTVYNILTFLKE